MTEMASQLEPWSCLDGKIVMVTGASSGFGLESCLDLARAGCRIVVAARRMNKLQSICGQINQMDASKHDEHGHFDRVVAVELDITGDNKTIDGAVQKAWDAFGHIDALVNNAGIRGEVKSSLELSEEEWDRVMKTNLKGSWLVSKCVGTRMRSSGRGGSIVNISSGAGLNRVQFHGAVAYSPSKAAMDAMTRVMALELGKYKIRVNSIAPGLFESEITEHLFQQVWLKDLATKITPMGAILTSDPGLTSLIRYLLHDSSSYVTGNVFIVDAGYTLPGVPIFSSL